MNKERYDTLPLLRLFIFWELCHLENHMFKYNLIHCWSVKFRLYVLSIQISFDSLLKNVKFWLYALSIQISFDLLLKKIKFWLYASSIQISLDTVQVSMFPELHLLNSLSICYQHILKASRKVRINNIAWNNKNKKQIISQHDFWH